MLTETHAALVPTVALYYMSSGGRAPPIVGSSSSLSPVPSSPSLLCAAEQALLSPSEDESDDGVAVVMNMLEAERATIAPLPPPDVDRLLAGWHAAEWGCGGERRRGSEGKSEDEEEREPWGYGEDCVVADVMTGVDPERQREEVRRRLPGRRWGEVCERFRQVCGEVLPKCEPVEEREASRWTRLRRWDSVRAAEERRLKPRCAIVKKFNRFNRWR